MRKKLVITCVAFAAFMAFAVLPAVASASPVMTYPTGTVLATGAALRAHSVGNVVLTTSGGNLVCSSASVSGTLTTNSGSQIEADIETASVTGTESEERCSSPLGAMKFTVPSLPWCLRSTEVTDGFELRGGSCKEAPRALTFILDFPSFECKYSRANANGTATTHPEDARLTISEVEFTKEAGSFLCPGSLKLDMTLTFERNEAGTNPIYIS